MKLYIVRVNEDGETYEYEYGCLEHAKEHVKMDKGTCRIYEYENGIETEVKEENTMTRTEKVQYIINAGIIAIDPCNLEYDNGSIYWLNDEEIDMIYDDTIEAQENKEKIEEINQQIAEEAMEEAKEWIEEAKKEEKTMKNTREYRYEIRQLDAWGNAEEGYDINESWHMGEMVTKAENVSKAFTAWMKRHLGITFKNNRTLIEYDGDCYTIIDRKTKEPLFIAIPHC